MDRLYNNVPTNTFLVVVIFKIVENTSTLSWMSSEAPAFTSSDTTLVLFFMTAIINADSTFYKKKIYIANIFTEQQRAFTSFRLSMFITVCSSGETASVLSPAIAVISTGHCVCLKII